MSTDNRPHHMKSLDHFPYFTVARSSKGHDAASLLPHGRNSINISPEREIITGNAVTFTLRAKDPHGRPMKVQVSSEGQETREYDITPDEDLTVEWTPSPDRHLQHVTFYLRGQYEGMHRMSTGTDQMASFPFIAFPRS